jgi:hypothetical protein
MLLQSKNNILIFFIIIFYLVEIILSQQNLDSNLDCKAILVNSKIIYIRDSDSDNNIYLYDYSQARGNSKGSISQSITKKRIINFKEKNFVIIGLNQYNKLYFGIYELSNDNSVIFKSEPPINLVLSNLRLIEGKYISDITDDLLILSVNDNNQFQVYLINLISGVVSQKIIIEDNDYIGDETYFKRSINCDSSDGNNFFCIFCYQGDEEKWKLFYIVGAFGGNKIGGIICDDCFLGNIIKISNSINKYLVCYQKKFGTLLSIFCQYYSYIDSHFLKDNAYEVGKVSGKMLIMNH